MSAELNTSVISTLVEVLKVGLPEAIGSLNEETGRETQTPVQVLDYMPVPATYNAGLPIVAVQDMPGRFSNDLQSSMESTWGLGVAALIQTADHETLAPELRDYLRAIFNVIQADRQLGVLSLMRKPPASVIYTEFAGTEPGPLLGNRNPENQGAPPDSFRSWTWLLLEVPPSRGRGIVAPWMPEDRQSTLGRPVCRRARSGPHHPDRRGSRCHSRRPRINALGSGRQRRQEARKGCGR